MFRALCKSRLQAYTASFLRSDRKGKMRSKGSLIGYGLLFAYVGVCFAYLFYMMAAQLALPLTQVGLSWLYFALFGIMATALGIVGSVFTTQSQLFEAKDNELLLSMPIPPSYILGSRMIALYVQNLVIELLVLLPALGAYAAHVGISGVGIALCAGIVLTLPALSLTLSCVLGWLVALISSRMRSKSLITMILSVVFLGAYFVVFSKMNTYLQMLLLNSDAVAETVRGVLFPLYQMGLAATGDAVAFVWYLLCMAVAFGVMYWVISCSFLKITTNKRGAAKIRYQEKKLDVSSPARALYRKELQHFWASPMYMLNGALGSLMLVVGAVALVLKKDALLSITQSIPGIESILPILLLVIISAVASMNLITAPSVSLEGKTLWIVQTFPVGGWAILRAKLQLHLVITCVPVLLCSLAGLLVLPMSMVEKVLIVLAPQLFSLLCALLGLILNLHFPRFDWTSEAVVVKRGMSVLISLFAGWAVLLGLGVGAYLLRGTMQTDVYLLLCMVVLAVGCLLQYLWLKTKGTAIFMALH